MASFGQGKPLKIRFSDLGGSNLSKNFLEIGSTSEDQNVSFDSFTGGYPKLPKELEIPTCQLCGKEQAFHFQLAFPEDHSWSGRSLALFSCISCSRENRLIPEMLKLGLKGAHIPKGFLDRYQKNFRVLVFPTEEGTIRTDYTPKLVWKPIQFVSK